MQLELTDEEAAAVLSLLNSSSIRSSAAIERPADGAIGWNSWIALFQHRNMARPTTRIGGLGGGKHPIVF
jgi:hypothetical protein